jgi:hypothetical protein
MVVQAGSVNGAAFAYDGRDRRKTYISGSLSETREFYFTSNWQDIEEQVNSGYRSASVRIRREFQPNGRRTMTLVGGWNCATPL